MGIEEVKKEILDNARKHAKQILDEAERESKAILKTTDTEITIIKEKIDKESLNSINQYKTMVLADANSQVKKQKLALERDLVNKVFEHTLEKLNTLKSNKREEHLKKILKTKFKHSKIYCAEKDLALIKSKKPDIAAIAGGLILEDKNSEIRLDLSYGTLLNNVKQEHLGEIAKILLK